MNCTKLLFAALVDASASQSYVPPGAFVSVAVRLAPGATVVALTAMFAGVVGGGLVAPTVTVGLVASRV
jgi:hypothetical protein